MPNVHKPGRNDGCPCGSGRKFKRCCGGVARGPGAGASGSVEPVAHTHYQLALALQQAGDDEAALDALRRALSLARGLAGAHAQMGDLLLARPEAHLLLGHLLNEAGRFAEAASSFERTLELDPGNASAYQGIVTSKKLTEADRPLVARMEERLTAAAGSAHQQMTLHFAAGKALDDLEDYARAMEHFDAANGIRARLSSFDRRDFTHQVDRLIATFTPDLFDGFTELGADDETPVLILGMPRSGTTLTERILSRHPRVAGGGELRFWRDSRSRLVEVEPSLRAQEAESLRGDYLRLLRSIGPSALRVTDKMPFNFLWIGLVHLLLPRARIVHCRRNPIDTCLSIYQTQFSDHWGFAADRGELVAYYRQYQRLMGHWREVLPPDRMLEIDYEEATAAPEATARRLVAFCGLEWDAACLQPERNADAVRTASKWQARQPVYRTSVERWRRYEPWIGALRELLPAVSTARRP